MENKLDLIQERNMKGYSKGLYTVIRILRGFAIAGVIVSGIFAVLVLILGEKMVVPGTLGDLDLGSVSLELTKAGTPSFARMKPAILLQLAFGALMSGMLWLVFATLVKIMKEASEGRPFSEKMPAALRNLGYGVIAYGVLNAVLDRIYVRVVMSACRFSSLWNPELVKSFDINSVNIWIWVAGGMLLFFFSYVFRYGMKLQRESDETL